MTTREWEPITERVAWQASPFLSFRKARTSLEAELGPPQFRDLDSNGCGPYDAWGLRFPCGLDVLLLAFHIDSLCEVPPDQETWVEIQSNQTDWPHILTHLPFVPGEISPWLPDRRTSDPPSWVVMRQDDNGVVFEVESYTSNCEANLRAQALESLGHKQTYWVVHRVEKAG